MIHNIVLLVIGDNVSQDNVIMWEQRLLCIISTVIGWYRYVCVCILLAGMYSCLFLFHYFFYFGLVLVDGVFEVRLVVCNFRKSLYVRLVT